jgi:hypothetical protein
MASDLARMDRRGRGLARGREVDGDDAQAELFEALAQEVEGLHAILAHLENSQVFYNAHELVDRDYITNRVKKIKKAVQFVELKPFRFLINKN